MKNTSEKKEVEVENKNDDESTDFSGKKLKSQASVMPEEAFVFHSPSIMMHFTQANQLDEFGNLNVN